MSERTLEQVLEEDGILYHTSKGVSMRPLIREGKDILVIKKPAGRLKKYDIPLYKRDSGEYVLHRILKVREKDYVICGDNRWQKETGITDRHIIGVLTEINRGGKIITMKEPRYRLYVHLWCDLFFLRKPLLLCRRKLHGIKRRLGKWKKK